MSILNTDNHPPRHESAPDKPKVCYCRCWKSKKFPYCDGSHREYNAETGDNLGPMVIVTPTE